MDGLECSEIALSDTYHLNADWFRLDSHFYEKKYIMLKQKLETGPHWYLKDLVEKPIQTGHTPSMKNASFYGGTIALIKTDNLRENFISDVFSDYLSEQGNAEIARTALQEDDIITTIIGATEDVIARSALITKRFLPANINQNIVQIRINQHVVSPAFVNAYFNSYYGRNYMQYLSRQTEQVNLNCKEIEQVLVPQCSKALSDMIEACTTLAHNKQQRAQKSFCEVQKTLQHELNLNLDQEVGSISVLELSRSFRLSGRLDAEYYQPKYDVLFDTLRKLRCKSLGGENGIVSIKKSIEPGSEAYQNDGIPFVRVSDISKYEIEKPEIYLSHNVVKDVESLYPKKDTILFSKDGSVGIAYKLERDEDIITSGALLHLTVKNTSEVLPDYLTLILNSPVVQMQAERDSNGAIIQHWKPSEIENVIVPVLDMDKQKELAEMVQKSFALRRQSKQLLEYAKRTVEIAIEQGDDVALVWLREKVSEVGA